MQGKIYDMKIKWKSIQCNALRMKINIKTIQHDGNYKHWVWSVAKLKDLSQGIVNP